MFINSFCKIISEAPIDFKSFSALACLVKAVTLKPILDRIKIENKPTPPEDPVTKIEFVFFLIPPPISLNIAYMAVKPAVPKNHRIF